MSPADAEAPVWEECSYHDDEANHPAVATICMLDTASLDALTLICGPCLIDFWRQWVVQTPAAERMPFAVDPI